MQADVQSVDNNGDGDLDNANTIDDEEEEDEEKKAAVLAVLAEHGLQ